MMFYTFTQNKCSGYFIGPKHIIIECSSIKEANQIAIQNNILFETSREKDSTRWEMASEHEDTHYLYDIPSYYGVPINKTNETYKIIYLDSPSIERR